MVVFFFFDVQVVTVVVAVLIASVSPVRAALKLPSLLDNGMVLQRDVKAVLWGWSDCDKGEVTVRVHDAQGHIMEETSARIELGDGNAGRSWEIRLKPHCASTKEHSLEVFDECGGNVTLSRVLFGDVLLCSEQSNMEFALRWSRGGSKMADTESEKLKLLRMFTGARHSANTPSPELPPKFVDDDGSGWVRSRPQAFEPNDEFGFPSAVCVWTARELYHYFEGAVPVGMVGSYWGGTKVELWSSSEALADTTCGGTQKSPDALPPDIKEHSLSGWSLDQLTLLGSGKQFGFESFVPGPSQLFNGMIYPLLKMQFKAALWYQGEANAGNSDTYACRFPALIADWRKKMAQPLPFYFVQLAGFKGVDFTAVRVAQRAALKLPITGWASAIDIGNQKDIHPRNKAEVGRRLSLSLLRSVYGDTASIVSETGPELESVDSDNGDTRLLRVRFKEGSAQKLFFNSTENCDICCKELPIELRLTNGTWIRARSAKPATDDSNDLLVETGFLTGINAIRLLWETFPQCALYSNFGGRAKTLPATPFQTDL